jgi:hypothetical protein
VNYSSNFTASSVTSGLFSPFFVKLSSTVVILSRIFLNLVWSNARTEPTSTYRWPSWVSETSCSKFYRSLKWTDLWNVSKINKRNTQRWKHVSGWARKHQDLDRSCQDSSLDTGVCGDQPMTQILISWLCITVQFPVLTMFEAFSLEMVNMIEMNSNRNSEKQGMMG